MIIAADRKQARTIFRYIAGIMRAVPVLDALIEAENAEEMRLKKSVNIEVMTASTKSVRGYAVPVLLLDEVAFLAGEGGADADVDILASVSPAMKQFPRPHARGAGWVESLRPAGAFLVPAMNVTSAGIARRSWCGRPRPGS